MPRAIDRRRFLRVSAGALPIAAGLGACAWGPHVDVAVVGGGLAGLRAADRVRRGGARVVVLEARDRPGGRVRTIRAPLDEELYGELGAIRIPDRHHGVRDLVSELGLSLVPFESGNGAAVVGVGGATFRMPAEMATAARALRLRADEAGQSPRALLERYAADLPPELGDPAVSSDAYAAWSSLDGTTWPAWLASRGASPGAVTLMCAGGDSRDLSALYVLRQFAMLRGVEQYYKVLGGMEQLPATMAARLGDAVVYNAEVVSLAQDASGVTVSYRHGGADLRTVRAGRVILAVPFSLLRRIEIRPPLPAPRQQAIETLPYFPAARALLQTRSRFWHLQNLSGTSRTDQPAETWDAAYEQPADRGLLGVTVGGALGRELAALPHDTAVARVRTLAAATFPSLTGEFEKGMVHPWAADRWAGGAFAVFHPGQMSAMMPGIVRPEGRLHFAGEHTSPWMGWMEGALESGERAASEVLAA